MSNLEKLGQSIKERRLSLNLRMEDVARKAGITRATLWSIEKGSGKSSMSSLFAIMNVLGMNFSIDDVKHDAEYRVRATRRNSALDKKINHFVIMCVQQYASASNEPSYLVYKKMSDYGVIKDLVDDYEDLHGMSTAYLNDYIATILERN